jgi:hypothetical protein
LLAEATLAVSVLALAAALFALLVSLGTAARVSRIGASGPQPGTEGLPAGARAPTGELERLVSGVGVDQLAAGPTLLLFVSDGCGACLELVDDLNRAASKSNGMLGDATVVLVQHGSESLLRERACFSAHWVADADGKVHTDYRVASFPFTYLIQGGRVARAAIGTNPEIPRWVSDGGGSAAASLQ